MPSRNTHKWLLPVLSQNYVAVDQKEPLELSGYGQEEPTRRNSSKAYFYNAMFFLLGALVCLSLFFWFPRSDGISSTPGIPQFKSSWKEDARFSAERNDSESVVACASLNSRFIWVENPIQKGLQPSWPEGASRQMYSIAGFHQLHCTYVIYFAWNALRNNGPSVLDNAFPGTGGHYTIGGHFGHCLEIIRNALMCYADPTLEPTLDMDGETISEIGLASGWGTLHTCKNYEKLVTWIDAQEKAVV
ncbi:hypothetical protein NA56DRAFT_732730 [Hyaloscypha hepaticicola]|uniref:Oxidase ustYa n=1 Tax=Hyaloscypha hepaticicola TaxID=2082293 RepID=A0A2J6PNQ5_9HELO|nr:hypothetical protein NA56DRAFT_732730 [Hyaloscypha hepaticicola]